MAEQDEPLVPAPLTPAEIDRAHREIADIASGRSPVVTARGLRLEWPVNDDVFSERGKGPAPD